MTKCGYCGIEFRSDERFCYKCGNALNPTRQSGLNDLLETDDIRSEVTGNKEKTLSLDYWEITWKSLLILISIIMITGNSLKWAEALAVSHTGTSQVAFTGWNLIGIVLIALLIACIFLVSSKKNDGLRKIKVTVVVLGLLALSIYFTLKFNHNPDSFGIILLGPSYYPGLRISLYSFIALAILSLVIIVKEYMVLMKKSKQAISN
jgi:hypothetical protein